MPAAAASTYANLRMLARVAGTVYDDALRPVDLRAGQLALMWAIMAAGPVEIGRLGVITVTDQTTLSRTIAKLKKDRLVSVRPGQDRRVKLVSLTETGRQRFRAAMPSGKRRNAARRRCSRWSACARWHGRCAAKCAARPRSRQAPGPASFRDSGGSPRREALRRHPLARVVDSR